MNNFDVIKQYHNNYVNYLITKIYGGDTKDFKVMMNNALAIIESVEDTEVKDYLYLRYVKNMSFTAIEQLRGWSRSKQYSLKCKAIEEV